MGHAVLSACAAIISTRSNDTRSRAATYSRCSSEHQREERIRDQQRCCHDAAQKNGHEILPDLNFFDEAVSGTKSDREGLNALLAAAERREFEVLYVHSLSRLSRDLLLTLTLLRRLDQRYHIRIISVSEGLDSNQDSWNMMITFRGLFHEQYLEELRVNVLRGHEGVLQEGYPVGDWCFGYGSEPVPGSEQSRPGRQSKPKMRYIINEETSEWVRRVFHWFVMERRSVRSIVSELNRLNAPKDHRSNQSQWHHVLVTRMLRNAKYIGIWPWGQSRNVRDPENGKVHQEARSKEEYEKWTRHFPELRIIDVNLFMRAPELLDENQKKWESSRNGNGQLCGSTPQNNGRKEKRLFSGILKCPACGSPFVSCGKRTKCRGSLRSVCDCNTSVRTELLEERLVNEIVTRLTADEDWFQLLLRLVIQNYQKLEADRPDVRRDLESKLDTLNRKIKKLLDLAESDAAPADLMERLKSRQKEKEKLQLELKRVERVSQQPVSPPDEKSVRAKLDQLCELIQKVSPDANNALSALVGGTILLEEVETPLRKRKHLRARFRIYQRSFLDSSVEHPPAEDSEPTGEEILVDLDEPSLVYEQHQRALELYDQGRLVIEIANELGVSKSRATAILKEARELAGRKQEDGRQRRASLSKKHTATPIYQEIADRVMELYHQDLPMHVIADQLGIDRNTVTKAVKYWHESRGETAPNGRTRRRLINEKNNRSREVI
ncbi:recombinase family protein [Calycomorphotria hydatis]|nr:recombinase family protein [Calycomorphotria hydatis]